MNDLIAKLRPLSAAATDVLWCLFALGPTRDGNLSSKCGRDTLVERGFADRGDGWNWLTPDGVLLSIGLGFDQKKDTEQAARRIPR